MKNKKLSGGVLLTGIHCIDVVRYFLGSNIIARSAKMNKCFEYGVPETRALLKYTCGDVVGSIDLSSAVITEAVSKFLVKKPVFLSKILQLHGIQLIFLYDSISLEFCKG